MAYTIDQLSALDMAVDTVSDKAILGPLTPEEEQLFSDITTLVTSALSDFSLEEKLKILKSTLEGSGGS